LLPSASLVKTPDPSGDHPPTCHHHSRSTEQRNGCDLYILAPKSDSLDDFVQKFPRLTDERTTQHEVCSAIRRPDGRHNLPVTELVTIFCAEASIPTRLPFCFEAGLRERATVGGYARAWHWERLSPADRLEVIRFEMILARFPESMIAELYQVSSTIQCWEDRSRGPSSIGSTKSPGSSGVAGGRVFDIWRWRRSIHRFPSDHAGYHVHRSGSTSCLQRRGNFMGTGIPIALG